MRLLDTPVAGAKLIEIDPIRDDRGYFARNYCRREFGEHGLIVHIEQSNMGFNARRGTLRGMHYQTTPAEEAKLVSCPRGAVFDVVLDLRPDSPSFRKWYGVELTADNGRLLYIPEGCAHGYQALHDDTLIIYNTSNSYAPRSAAGVRWDDPAFGIEWPLPPTVMSEADRSWPDFTG